MGRPGREKFLARKLAAILAADVVGYSRLMEADEAGTLATLKAQRTELVEPTVASHGGHIVKLMGDGMLIEFPSVVDAVSCAVAIQQGIAKHHTGLPEEKAHCPAHRHQSGRCHHRRRRHLRRRCERRGPPGDAGRTRRHLRIRHRARAHHRQTRPPLCRWRRADRQEHRQAGARLALVGGCTRNNRRCCASSPARQTFARRAALYQHVRRSRAGVLFRRHHRRHHHRA